MTTFEDILCKGKNAAECVGKKATDLVEVTKLKMEAAETEKDIASTLEGLGRLVRECCDVLVSIPMRGRVSSLNASAAAAVLIYEVLRQRQSEV